MQDTLPDLCPTTNISKVNSEQEGSDEVFGSCMREYVTNIVGSWGMNIIINITRWSQDSARSPGQQVQNCMLFLHKE